MKYFVIFGKNPFHVPDKATSDGVFPMKEFREKAHFPVVCRNHTEGIYDKIYHLQDQ